MSEIESCLNIWKLLHKFKTEIYKDYVSTSFLYINFQPPWLAYQFIEFDEKFQPTH